MTTSRLWESRSERLATFFTLRQQLSKRDGRPNLALSDFVAPAGDGSCDVGGFVVTSGVEEERVAKRFERANDDYASIMVKALADRLAEALAERMHARVRREFWAYAPDEALSTEAIIAENYRGIRPAPGYPAQPDHTEKATLFAPPTPSGASTCASPASPCGRARRCRALPGPPGRHISASPGRARPGGGLRPRKDMAVAEVERRLSPSSASTTAAHRVRGRRVGFGRTRLRAQTR